MEEQMTDEARAVFAGSRALARRCRHDSVDAPHFLLAMLGEPDSNACQVLNQAGLQYDEVLQSVRQKYAQTSAGQPIPYSAEAKTIIRLWIVESLNTGHSIIDTAHLALACTHTDELPSLQPLVAGREQTIRDAAISAVRSSERLQADLKRRREMSPADWQASQQRLDEQNDRRASTRLAYQPKHRNVSIRTLLLDPPADYHRLKIGDVLGMLPTLGPESRGKLLADCDIPPSETIGALSAQQRGTLLERLQPDT